MIGLEMAGKLTKRDKIFVARYMIDFKVYEAAIEAGYSQNMAKGKCYQWVSDRKFKPALYDAIQEGIAERLKAFEATPQNIIRELCKIAFSSEENNAPGMKNKAANAEKIRALELIGKHLGMWKENIALTGKDGEAIEIIQRVIIDPATAKK